MSEPKDLGTAISKWAQSEPSVRALVLIGSRVRHASDAIWQADAQSDWDFQIITSKPQMFADASWLRNAGDLEVVNYAARFARIGGVPKVNVIFRDTEADFVVLPARALRVLKLLVSIDLHRRVPWLRRKLQDLTVVIRPGWKFLKGAKTWERFYSRSVASIADPRLTNEDVVQLADAFVCDFACIARKIARGELLAAQRLLHRDLVEVNFRLFHELRLRKGERSFPEARRIERIASPQEIISLTVDAQVNLTGLYGAVEKAADTFRSLVNDLVGELWKWPNVNRSLPSAPRRVR